MSEGSVQASKAWAVWLALGLSSCARAVASTAPLSAGPAPPATLPPPAAPSPSAASVASAKPTAKPASKQGKRALYERSCTLGSAVGCNDLAILLGSADPQALTLLERACSLGLTRGCANWGTELLRGQPSDSQRTHGVKLLSDACEQNDAFACAELGDVLYAAYSGGDKSVVGRAYSAYQKSCKLNRTLACYSQGLMLRDGEGTARDAQAARELFRFVCSHDVYAACGALGYDLIDNAQNREEFEEGLRWSRLACEHDDAFGCFSLGSAGAAASDAKSNTEGLALLKRACTLGFANGCRYAEVLEQRMKQPTGKPAPTGADDDVGEEVDDPGEDQD